MRKTLVALAAVGVLTLGLSTTAFANEVATTTPSSATRSVSNFRPCGGGIRGMMWDADGNFMSREAFEQRLDEWVAAGMITPALRASYLEMYDFCGAYGGGAYGTFGNCIAGGRRGGMMRFTNWN